MMDLNRARLRSRYRITGSLVTDTALHIGGGRESSPITDSPVVRNPDGRPFIPGSSLKGAFRAAVERLVPLLNLRTCQLQEGFPDCLSTNRSLSECYGVISGQQGRNIGRDPDTAEALTGLEAAVQRLAPESPALVGLSELHSPGQIVTEEHLLALLDALLCDTCKTFGSVHLISSAFFSDLQVTGEWHDMFQVRDGVGIDRDSERAKDQIKFDYEVVPPNTAFSFELSLENPTERDLGLIAVGLQEFLQGAVPIGGIRSRGLGRCHLAPGQFQVESIDLSNFEQLRSYLMHGILQTQDATAFVATHVDWLMGTR